MHFYAFKKAYAEKVQPLEDYCAFGRSITNEKICAAPSALDASMNDKACATRFVLLISLGSVDKASFLQYLLRTSNPISLDSNKFSLITPDGSIKRDWKKFGRLEM
jgi:hypothetical protein